MSKRTQPTIDKPLAGKRVRYCIGTRPTGDYALKMFRKLGGKVVEKGSADILVIEHHYDGMVLTNPPKWMGYDARTELAAALAEADAASAAYQVISVSGFHEYVGQVQGERRAALAAEQARQHEALQSRFFALKKTETPSGFVGF